MYEEIQLKKNMLFVNVYFVVFYFLKNIRAHFHAWFALRVCSPVRVYVIIPYVSAFQNNLPNAECHQLDPVYVEIQNQDRFSYKIFSYLSSVHQYECIYDNFMRGLAP